MLLVTFTRKGYIPEPEDVAERTEEKREKKELTLNEARALRVELGKHHGTPDFPKLNKVQSKVFEPPLPEQVAALVAAADQHTRVAIGLAAYAGGRASEVIAGVRARRRCRSSPCTATSQ